MQQHESVSLLTLSQRLQRLITDRSTQLVWLTAELYDVRLRGGHCYMELLDKDADGHIVAKARAAIWANDFRRISATFRAGTGSDFATGMRVMLLASATYHPVYGLSLVVSDVDPSFTLGEREQRRRRILARLKAEGILEANKSLTWTDVPQRIAVISAAGAAGYGDFIGQLYHNPAHIRFNVQLYPALMQGERAAASIVSALEMIAPDTDRYDGVVIIRGGGATSDLECYESYELAAAIARFPLPVIIGIGHERDITLLDFVANMRVKTPTAAAEWLIARGNDALTRLDAIALAISSYIQRRVAGENERMTYCEGALAGISARRIAPEITRMEIARDKLAETVSIVMSRERERIDNRHNLISALSPRATLRRGFTATYINDSSVRSIDQTPHGTIIRTITADGIIYSRVESVRRTTK